MGKIKVADTAEIYEKPRSKRKRAPLDPQRAAELFPTTLDNSNYAAKRARRATERETRDAQRARDDVHPLALKNENYAEEIAYDCSRTPFAAPYPEFPDMVRGAHSGDSANPAGPNPATCLAVHMPPLTARAPRGELKQAPAARPRRQHGPSAGEDLKRRSARAVPVRKTAGAAFGRVERRPEQSHRSGPAAPRSVCSQNR